MDSTSSISSSFAITDKEFNLFHFTDRKLFTILISNLGLDLNESVHVMGFWLWLEQNHIKDLTIIYKILQLSYHILKQVVDETLVCMKLIENDTIQPENVGMEFHLLQTLIGKSFSLKELHADRLNVRNGVSRIINEVCVRAFCDIIEKFMKIHEPTKAMGEPSDLIGHGDPNRAMRNLSNWLGGVAAPSQLGLMQGGGDLKVENIPIRPIYVESNEIQAPFISGPTQSHYGMQFQGPAYPAQFGGNMPGIPEEQMRMMDNEMFNNRMYGGEKYDNELDADNRTIFLTFSKGYPISENEVREFFTRRFGDFIESIHMQKVQGDDQVLYARMIAKSVVMMDRIVEGSRRAKYHINGKHVCARKYVRSQKSTRHQEGDSV